MCLQFADDIELFTHVGREDSPLKSLSSLSVATSVDALLLKRILRHLSARHILRDFPNDPDLYGATAISSALADKDASAGIRNACRIYIPSFIQFPSLLRESGYKAPSDPRNGIFQRQHGLEGLTMFECLQRPENRHLLEDFNRLMKYTTKGRRSFLDVCDIGALMQQVPPASMVSKKEGHLFVDIGGGTGTDAFEFRSRFPDVSGVIELQELKGVITDVQQAGLQGSGVSLRVHDFFTPQPVHGSRFYFMGSVLHDWPDKDAERILEMTAVAMQRGYSTLLLSENVLPDAGCHPHLSAMDLTMATMLAGRERSENDWNALLERVGLKIAKVHTIPSCLKSVLECELKPLKE